MRIHSGFTEVVSSLLRKEKRVSFNLIIWLGRVWGLPLQQDSLERKNIWATEPAFLATPAAVCGIIYGERKRDEKGSWHRLGKNQGARWRRGGLWGEAGNGAQVTRAEGETSVAGLWASPAVRTRGRCFFLISPPFFFFFPRWLWGFFMTKD